MMRKFIDVCRIFNEMDVNQWIWERWSEFVTSMWIGNSWFI